MANFEADLLVGISVCCCCFWRGAGAGHPEHDFVLGVLRRSRRYLFSLLLSFVEILFCGFPTDRSALGTPRGHWKLPSFQCPPGRNQRRAPPACVPPIPSASRPLGLKFGLRWEVGWASTSDGRRINLEGAVSRKAHAQEDILPRMSLWLPGLSNYNPHLKLRTVPYPTPP